MELLPKSFNEGHQYPSGCYAVLREIYAKIYSREGKISNHQSIKRKKKRKAPSRTFKRFSKRLSSRHNRGDDSDHLYDDVGFDEGINDDDDDVPIRSSSDSRKKSNPKLNKNRPAKHKKQSNFVDDEDSMILDHYADDHIDTDDDTTHSAAEHRQGISHTLSIS
jgi:hypothetical protein